MNTAEQASTRRLQAYAIEQALANQSGIAPELMSYIGGSSEEEIDASIERAKTKTVQILAGIRQAQARPSDVDPAWQTNVREGVGDPQVDVSNMSMREYARERGRLGMFKSTIDFLGGAR